MQDYPQFKQGNLVDQVFESLRTEIVSGRMQQGQRFPPQDILARNLGVSRTVIREAQKKLSSLGLVKCEQGRGTFVSAPDSHQLLDPMLSSLTLDKASTRELLEARYHMENVVARLAASRATACDVDRLEKIVAAMRTSAEDGDLAAFSRHDNAFHRELADISKNGLLRRILSTLWDLNYCFLMTFTRTAGAIERAITYHQCILDAVAKNDPALAERQMTSHMQDIIKSVKRHYDLDMEI